MERVVCAMIGMLHVDMSRIGKGTRTLKCVQTASKLSCSDLLTAIRDKQLLHHAAYTQREIEKLLGVDLMSVFAVTPKLQQVLADKSKTNYHVYQVTTCVCVCVCMCVCVCACTCVCVFVRMYADMMLT